jgi:hypothetical protein
VGVAIVSLSHYLDADKLGLSSDVEPLYSRFGGDVQAIYLGLVFCHIIGSEKMQWDNVKESISLRRQQHYTSPGTVEGEGAIKVHAPIFLSDWWGGCWVSKSSRDWDLIVV